MYYGVGLINGLGWSTQAGVTGRARANATVQAGGAVWGNGDSVADAHHGGGQCANGQNQVHFVWTGEYEYLARLDLARK